MSSREIKILLVDDEAEILYALKAVIETQGWTGLIAQNVKQALEIYKTDSPDIILIDYHMPHINGVVFTCHLATRSIRSTCTFSATVTRLRRSMPITKWEKRIIWTEI